MRCSDTAIINFDNVRIPAENIIGDEGMGFTYQMMQVKISKLNRLSNVNDHLYYSCAAIHCSSYKM